MRWQRRSFSNLPVCELEMFDNCPRHHPLVCELSPQCTHRSAVKRVANVPNQLRFKIIAHSYGLRRAHSRVQREQ